MIVPTRICFWRILKIVWPRLCLYLLSAKLKLLKDLWILSLIAELNYWHLSIIFQRTVHGLKPLNALRWKSR